MRFEIKKMLMKNKINYNKLNKLLCYDFEKVVDEFFDALYDVSNNKKKLEDIFLFLKKIIIEFDNDKLDVIVIKCLELNSKIKNNCDDDVGTMLRNLVVFCLKCHEDIDVHKALVDNDYLNGFLSDNIS